MMTIDEARSTYKGYPVVTIDCIDSSRQGIRNASDYMTTNGFEILWSYNNMICDCIDYIVKEIPQKMINNKPSFLSYSTVK